MQVRGSSITSRQNMFAQEVILRFLSDWASEELDSRSIKVDTTGPYGDSGYGHLTSEPDEHLAKNLCRAYCTCIQVSIRLMDDYIGIDNEPARRVLTPSPPKRFYSSFWRSAAQRVLENDSVRKRNLSNA